ncbi:sensor histidine kinase [Aquipuribacter nitratireducens]|uniref:histidine kinase n=1 Tax=Aquipuribacter nitratireducens TaxID=650104 RepID=A0ABW0GKZ1_9MICO
MTRSVRAQVVGAVVLLLVVGLAVSAVLSYVVQYNDVDERVARELEQEVQEFETLASGPLNPVTGEPWQGVDEVLTTLVTTLAPEENQVLLGFVDGRLVTVQESTERIDFEDETAALADIVAFPAPGIGSTDTSQGRLAFAAVPVVDPADGRDALFVATYLVSDEYAEVTGTIRDRAVVYGAVVVVVAAVGWLLLGRLLAPLAALRDAAASIDDQDLSRRIDVEGRDEVSDLGRRFNAMLDRLESAFASQRDLLNDVGHELRTPVTIVRGHLDLLDADDPTDVRATRELVLDELDRMSRLVDDLITLAKSERPDFVRPGPVDVTVLTDEVLEKVSAVAPRSWRLDGLAAGTVLLDRERVTQALVQLAANAVTHTAPHDEIAIGSARVAGDDTGAGDRVLLWVRDTGPGVDPDDEEHIFRRFGRGTGEDRGSGTGLGLAIVQAIAVAHGGGVVLENAPGEGATFVLDLPWVPAGQPDEDLEVPHRPVDGPYPPEGPPDDGAYDLSLYRPPHGADGPRPDGAHR